MEATNKVLVEGKGILDLIPQRAPFVMVDKLISVDEKITISSFKVKKDNIFCKNDCLQAPALIENIAQTAALRMGYLASKSRDENSDEGAPLGFIGAITDLKLYHLPKIDSEFITEIIFEREVLDVIIIKGFSSCQGKKLAECEMKLYIKKN